MELILFYTIDPEGYLGAVGSRPPLPEGVEIPPDMDYFNVPDGHTLYFGRPSDDIPRRVNRPITVTDIHNTIRILLINSDWTQLPDVRLTPEQVQLWRDYREEVRDVPEQPGFPDPNLIVWPIAPNTPVRPQIILL